MTLRAVKDISIISTTTGVSEIDAVLSNLLLHLELTLEKCETPFIMSSIPSYIARTLYEHTTGTSYSHQLFTILDHARSKSTMRVVKVYLRLSFDNKGCHAHPLPVAWCYCEKFTAIDMSTWIDEKNTEHSCDIFTGLAISSIFDSELFLNQKKIQKVELIKIKEELALRLNKHDILMQPSEPLLTLLCPQPNRLSIETMTRELLRHKTPSRLTKVKIVTLQESGTYAATVEFGSKKYTMIPSHAVLLATLRGEGQVYVDDKLLLQTS